MKISIITPCLNSEVFIAGLIASIKGQTYKNYEHIIIDGGSSDNTLDLLKEYKISDSRVIVKSEKDEGMYYAINKGLNLATGDVICYLNTDDRYFPWTLQVVSESFLSNLDHPMLLYGDTMHFYRYEGISSFYPRIYPNISIKYLLFKGFIGQPAVFWNRSLFNMLLFFNCDFRLIADHEYWIRAMINPGIKIKKLNEFLAIELNHDRTLRQRYKEILKNERDIIFNKYSGNIKSPNFKELIFFRLLQLQFLYRITFRSENKYWTKAFNDFNISVNLKNFSDQILNYNYFIINNSEYYKSILNYFD